MINLSEGLLDRKITVLTMVRERPRQAPPGWLVWNAPRPIAGSFDENDKPVHWQGSFRHGIFYAAVRPTDHEDEYDEAEMWVKHNLDLDAWLIRYVSQAYVDAWATKHAKENGIDLDEFDEGSIRQSFSYAEGCREMTLREALEVVL